MVQWRELPGLLKMSLKIVSLFAAVIFLGGGCTELQLEDKASPGSGAPFVSDVTYNAKQASNFTRNIADFLAEMCTPQDQHCNDLVTDARNAAQAVDDAINTGTYTAPGGAQGFVATPDNVGRLTDAVHAAAAAAREAFHWCLVLGVYPNRASIPNIPGYSETFWDVHVD